MKLLHEQEYELVLPFSSFDALGISAITPGRGFSLRIGVHYRPIERLILGGEVVEELPADHKSELRRQRPIAGFFRSRSGH